jgi:hypothetical protein
VGEDRHRLDVRGLEMGKQLVQVWNVEPAASKVGALTRKQDGQLRDTGDEGSTHDFAFESGV